MEKEIFEKKIEEAVTIGFNRGIQFSIKTLRRSIEQFGTEFSLRKVLRIFEHTYNKQKTEL